MPYIPQMPEIEQAAFDAVQSELVPDETVLWAGRPDASVLFHREDILLVPFSLLWGGFAIFWETMAIGMHSRVAHLAPWFFVLWGIPFVVIGQYIVWGRFLVTAWKKQRTFYALTDYRALVVQNGWNRKISSAKLDDLPSLVKDGVSDTIGTLHFAPMASAWSGRGTGWGAWDGMSIEEDVPVFRDVERVDDLYQLIAIRCEQLRKSNPVTRSAPRIVAVQSRRKVKE
ncbi:MAG TPA: hypothetical protein VM578_13680 [Candidatus Saccharimonadales bacterium]|nr:hypothetical protein [Candidatus Saccharimonadales bacterium]